MTSLRLRMMEDMQVRNLSRNTQDSYLLQVSHFAKSPALLGPEDIHAYQVYLTNEKKLAPRSVQVTVAALRFLYRVTLGLDWDFDRIIPCPKTPKTLAVILSPEEVLHFLGCIESFKHQAILTTCYAAGLRISEATRLKPEAIDRQRMVLRVEQGKGQKDRYVMLSARLLEVLTDYWRAVRPTGAWMFPGAVAGEPISTSAVDATCRQAHRMSKLSKPVTPHSCGTHLRCTCSKLEPILRTIQLLLGHRSLSTTAQYLRIATNKVCAATSPLELLPRPIPKASSPPALEHFWRPASWAARVRRSRIYSVATGLPGESSTGPRYRPTDAQL